jgi:hypothetical protein
MKDKYPKYYVVKERDKYYPSILYYKVVSPKEVFPVCLPDDGFEPKAWKDEKEFEAVRSKDVRKVSAAELSLLIENFGA